MIPGNEHHPQHRTPRRMRAKVSAVMMALRAQPGDVERRIETEDYIDNYPWSARERQE